MERAGGPTHGKNKWVYPVAVRAHGWGRADAHQNRVVYIYALLVLSFILKKILIVFLRVITVSFLHLIKLWH